MKIWKRNAVISCIVLFVAVALYLSWAYGRDTDPDSDVFDPVLSHQSASPAPSPSGTPAPSGSSQGAFNDFFTETRLSRQQARDSALSILNQAAENVDATQAVLDNVAGEIEKLAAYAMSEASIEMLVRAKGFTDCVAFINQDGIKVLVTEPIGGLTAADAAKIKDIILSECEVAVADITLVPVEG